MGDDKSYKHSLIKKPYLAMHQAPVSTASVLSSSTVGLGGQQHVMASSGNKRKRKDSMIDFDDYE